MNGSLRVRICAFLLLLTGFSIEAIAQTGQIATGTPNFASFDSGPENINLGNLNTNWQFPIISKAGRGEPFSYSMTYDSSLWEPAISGSTKTWQSQGEFGWVTGGSGYYTYSVTYSSVTCVDSVTGVQTTWYDADASYSNFKYIDRSNTAHTFAITTQDTTPCASGSSDLGASTASSATGTSSDGYIMVAVGNNVTVTTPGGVVITFSYIEYNALPPTTSGNSVYANGNTITSSGGVFTDTLGTTALTISGSQNSPPFTMSYAGPSGSVAAHLNYTAMTVQTNFGCSSINEYGPTSVNLPTSLSLPDGRSYTFTYEPTPGNSTHVTGRLKSVTLPTGGTISYVYSGGSNNTGINCSDGSIMGLSRTTPDGTTTYARSAEPTGTAFTSTTTINWPSNITGISDQTIMTFEVQYFSHAYQGSPVMYSPTEFYELTRKEYAGSSGGQTLVRTTLTCYETASCSSQTGDGQMTYIGAVPPLRQVTVQWPDYTGIASGYLDVYDYMGNITSHAIHDYGSGGSFGSLLQTTTTTYTVPGSTAGSTTEQPSEIKVTDGSGATVSDIQYVYDEGTAKASGAPQLTAGYTYGNVTTTKQLVSGTTYLTSHNSYYDDGLIYQATDANGNMTTYTYGACGDAFVTAVSSGGLSSGATWDCNGGVADSTTDANGNTTTYSYGSDPFWRVASVTDNATGNVTMYTYPTSSSNSSSSMMTFNSGASISGTLTTFDGLGRALVQQSPTSPSKSSYNSVSFAYDARGRLAGQSIPYSAAAGIQSPTGAANWSRIIFDVLDRVSSYTDSGGGTVAYTYAPNSSLLQNTTLIANGPAPTGENLKRRQLSYNGTGWLMSVCEVTSLTGAASCGSGSGQTGYLTKYTYNGNGQLLTVKQNAQSGSVQTRQISYDDVGRKTSELIPEWTNSSTAGGTGTYTYDTDSSGVCSGSYIGDLIKSTDNAGNATCFTYDGLHRMLSSQVVSGPYASVTPQSHYIYDVAYGALPTLNRTGSLAEAYTCTGTCSSKITDQFFSAYPEVLGTTRTGRLVSQSWEWTPHSNGPVLSQDIFYPNGVLGATSLGVVGTGPKSTGTITLAGSEQTCDDCNCRRDSCNPVADAGTITITVNGIAVGTASYGHANVTIPSLATLLVSSINSNTNSPVTASYSGSGSVVTLTSIYPGAQADYSLSASVVSNDPTDFTPPSFSATPSSANMTGASGSLFSVVGPAMTYTLDGMGRPITASDGTRTVVTGTSYNVAGSPTSITFGNSSTGAGSDVDSFGYDPSTFRPTSFGYAVKPTGTALTISGALTWNPNGSLKQLAYTDSGDATKSQTCVYSADDLSRLASVNCGSSAWGQNFTYDAFGNINKTVPSANTGTNYTASYSPVTNHVSSGITPTPSYDANGNQLTATSATLTWNALAQPITVNGTNATYDALGNMVETGSGSSYKQFFFHPSGGQLAVYSSGLIKETIPLPGGDTAIYNASGLNYIRHTDWLGSSRLGTTWAHAVYSKEAYAPFGEVYNEAGTADRSFTGQDQDVVSGSAGTGVYDFLLRKYDPSAGRWLSPDPMGWAAVDPTTPQTLDRYTYSLNNPLTLVDPNGGCTTYYTWSESYSGEGGYVSTGEDSYDDGSPCSDMVTIYEDPGSGGSGGSGVSGSAPSKSTCTVTDGRTTGVGPGQAPGPPGSVAIDPTALGLPFGTTYAENFPTVNLLKSYGAQITLSFSPAPNLPQGFATTFTVLGTVGPASSRIGGANFNGLFDFDFFGLPSMAAAFAVTSKPGVPIAVTVTYPSSLPIFCSGQNIDSPIQGPLPTSPGPISAVKRRLQ